MENYYTVRQAAEKLQRSRQTILAYIHGGLLPAHKLTDAPNSKFIIAESDIEALIKKGVPDGYYQALYPRPHKRDRKNDK